MHSDPRIKTALQDDDGFLSQIPFPLHPFAKCWRVFQKIPASIQIVCTDWPATNDEPPNIVQDPFRIIQGDWSLGVLLARTLDDTRRHPSNLAISWCSCLSLQICWNRGRSCVAFLKGVSVGKETASATKCNLKSTATHLLTRYNTRTSALLRFVRGKFTVPLVYAASKRYCRGKRQGKNTCYAPKSLSQLCFSIPMGACCCRVVGSLVGLSQAWALLHHQGLT